MPDVRIDEGFKILLDIETITTPLYWEQEITPPEVDGGELIPVSNQRNTLYHTAVPRTLIKIGDMMVKISAAIAAYGQLRGITNKNKKYTLTYPDGGKQEFYAALRHIKPGSYTIGNQPTWDLTIGVTNIKNTDGTEQGPVEIPPP